MVTPSPSRLHDPCGGILCLDFVNSVSRSVTGSCTESIHTYDDLVRWSLEAGSLEATPAPPPGLGAEALARARDEVLVRARDLREATFRVFSAQVHGRAIDPGDLDAINLEVGAALSHARVHSHPDGYAWGWDAAPDHALLAPLWPLARSVAELLVSDQRERVKECDGEGCLWIFLDRSRNGRRRWCEMSVCGNRHKVAAHRRRNRDETAS